MKLNLNTQARIYQALKAAGHWYYVDVGAWQHPANTVPNCFAIRFDGSVQCKFEVLNNGMLRLYSESISNSFLPIEKVMKVGDAITVTRLIKGILEHPFNRGTSQNVSLQKCKDIIREKSRQKR